MFLAWVGCQTIRVPEFHQLQERNVFGVTLRWTTLDQTDLAKLTKIILTLEEKNRMAMDPDCKWRKSEKNLCPNSFPLETQDLEKVAALYRAETEDTFNIQTISNGKLIRDFAGLSQGYFIEQARSLFEGPMAMDFSGDIFISQKFSGSPRLTIAEPVLEQATFAEVKMGEGWMIAATARPLGAELRNPKVKGTWKEDFQRVVLFARPEFNGARLDAWSTAIVIGGRKLLAHLLALKQFAGQWAFLTFDLNLKPTCSKNIDCDFQNKTIKINWLRN